MLSQFLLDSKVNQFYIYIYIYIYIYPLFLKYPSNVGHHRTLSIEFPVLYSQFSVICFIHSSVYMWRRKWQPTPVFLPGESQGRGSLVGCRLWGRTESDTTEATQQQQQQQCIYVIKRKETVLSAEMQLDLDTVVQSEVRKRKTNIV